MSQRTGSGTDLRGRMIAVLKEMDREQLPYSKRADLLMARLPELGADTVSPSLPEFLRARTAEDRAHIARWDPAHVLAHAAAVQRLVDKYETASTFYDRRSQTPAGEMTGLRFALRCAALLYADHPEYNAEWAPLTEVLPTQDHPTAPQLT